LLRIKCHMKKKWTEIYSDGNLYKACFTFKLYRKLVTNIVEIKIGLFGSSASIHFYSITLEHSFEEIIMLLVFDVYLNCIELINGDVCRRIYFVMNLRQFFFFCFVEWKMVRLTNPFGKRVWHEIDFLQSFGGRRRKLRDDISFSIFSLSNL
jgi:hypothetical protein